MSVSIGDRVICKFNLRGMCRFGKRCRNVHEDPEKLVEMLMGLTKVNCMEFYILISIALIYSVASTFTNITFIWNWTILNFLNNIIYQKSERKIW